MNNPLICTAVWLIFYPFTYNERPVHYHIYHLGEARGLYLFIAESGVYPHIEVVMTSFMQCFYKVSTVICLIERVTT